MCTKLLFSGNLTKQASLKRFFFIDMVNDTTEEMVLKFMIVSDWI